MPGFLPLSFLFLCSRAERLWCQCRSSNSRIKLKILPHGEGSATLAPMDLPAPMAAPVWIKKNQFSALNWGCAMLDGSARSLIPPGALPKPWKPRGSLISFPSSSFCPAWLFLVPSLPTCPLPACSSLVPAAGTTTKPQRSALPSIPLLLLEPLGLQHNDFFFPLLFSVGLNKQALPVFLLLPLRQPSASPQSLQLLEKIAGVSMKGLPAGAHTASDQFLFT